MAEPPICNRVVEGSSPSVASVIDGNVICKSGRLAMRRTPNPFDVGSIPTSCALACRDRERTKIRPGI
jgi:hypothetical protein